MHHRAFSLAFTGLLLSACSTAEAPQSRIASEASAGQHSPGVVSAADPRAAEAGAQMLRQGGSATDAAIATMLALTVVEPQSSGLGGGGFFLQASDDGTVSSIDGRETAPASATPERFLAPDGTPLSYADAVIGGLSVGVPGNLALAAKAHAEHGRLSWESLFQPAIALARDGFTVTERFREFLQFAQNRAGHGAFGRNLFYDAQGEALPVGTRLRNPELAKTLQQIAEKGPDYFYRSAQAAGMAETIASQTQQDGRMTAADLAAYEAKDRPAVCGTYRVYRICGMGPPSSGATTVFAILKQLEGFDLAALGPDSPVSWHLFAESQRLAYADRALFLADSDFVPVPVKGLTDPDYLAMRGDLIAIDKRMRSVEAGRPAGADLSLSAGSGPAENGTSHFVVADGEGNVVSYTSTVEGPFGSGLTYGGFFLNNELTDFSFLPERDGRAVANRVQGGKRPRSSMAPTIVFGPDGEPMLAVGAAGGSTIPVQVAKALIGVLDWDLSAQDAIALPGVYAPEDVFFVENGSPLLAMREELEALGHTVRERRMSFKANAAELVDGRWIGAADPRSEGAAISE